MSSRQPPDPNLPPSSSKHSRPPSEPTPPPPIAATSMTHHAPDSSRKRGRHAKHKSIDRTPPVRASPSGSSEHPSEQPDSPAAHEPSPSEAAQPGVKRKRTRTLTTPHQSEVLHALLAKSRFPTTAEREEVGRSIGLTARKVQVWFQNQRQKARRTRNQGNDPGQSTTTTPIPNPEAHSQPHYTPNASTSATRSSYAGVPYSPSSGPSSASHQSEFYSPYHESVYPPPTPTPPPHLASQGYGMTGPSVSGSLGPPPFRRGHPDSPPRTYYPPPPVTAVPPRSEPPIVLPPLSFDPRRQVPHLGRGGSKTPEHNRLHTAASTSGHSATGTGSSSFSSTSSAGMSTRRQSLEQGNISRPPTASLPPPFTLQPPPQWSPSTTRRGLEEAAAIDHTSSRSRSPTTTDPTRDLPISALQLAAPSALAPSRSTRFDPVRSLDPPVSPQTSSRKRAGTDHPVTRSTRRSIRDQNPSDRDKP